MKTKRTATAVAYHPDNLAPLVVAQGQGAVADQIIKLAKAAGVSIVEDRALAALLEPLSIGEAIPEICWEAVARIIAFIMAMEKSR